MKYIFKRNSLTFKLTVYMIFCILVAIVILAGVFSFAYFNYAKHKLRDNSMQDLKAMAYSISPALEFDDKVAAEELLSLFENTPEIISIQVIKTDGNIYIEKHFLRARDAILTKTIDLNTPIVNEAEQRLGFLSIKITLEFLMEEMKNNMIKIFWLALGIIVLSLFFVVFMVRKFLKPLLSFKLAIDDMIKKGYNGKVKVYSKDEIGDLAESFNKMSENLQRTTVSRDKLVWEIAERKKAEEELLLFRKFAQTSRQGFAMATLEGKLIYMNPACQNLLAEDEVKSIYGKKEVANYYLPQNKEMLLTKIFPEVREKGHWMGEITLVSAKGRQIPAIQNIFIIKDKQDQPLYFGNLLTDITEQKQAEEDLKQAYQELKETQQQLVQSSKMVAMGQLAAGVSHELNQPLTGIKGFAQTMMLDMAEDDPLRDDLNRIVQQADRMAEIIQNVRFFARKSTFKAELIDINDPIEKAMMLLTEQLRVQSIDLSLELTPGLPKINGDANRLQQIILNFVTNARDAICSLKEIRHGQIIIKTYLSPNKQEVEMLIQDNGSGISAEILEHIYNPFFTTKSPDGGMGLGLSIVYRIIEKHKAGVTVKSEEGKGTTFTVSFPVAK